MELTGTYTFPASKEAVWEILMDSDAIAEALPGVDELIPLENEENAWRAEAKISIGPVTGKYTGYVRMSDIQAPNSYCLSVHGEGQSSVIEGSADMTLTSDGDNSTTLNWVAHADISGKIAGIGQRLINATANMMSKRFFGALGKQLEQRVK